MQQLGAFVYRAGFAAFLLKRTTIFLKHSLLTVFIGHVGQTECDWVNDFSVSL